MNHDVEYLNTLQEILNSGTFKDDRTGTGTLSCFSRQMRFDLSTGTIPLLTTKKMHVKSIIHELLWFLQGTGSGKYLKNNNIRIWNEWMDSDDHLHKIYGYQWRRWPVSEVNDKIGLVPIKNNLIVDEPFDIPKNNIVTCTRKRHSFNDIDIIGKTFEANKYGSFTVVEKNNNSDSYKIQFIETTTIMNVMRESINTCKIRDPWKKHILNIGCVGEIKDSHNYPYLLNAYKLWCRTIKQCYDTNKSSIVEKSWKCFSNFLHDIRYIPGFDKWKDDPTNTCLCIDYFMAQYYSKDTCVFITKKYHNQISNHDGTVIEAQNDQTCFKTLSIKDMSKMLKLSVAEINNQIANKSNLTSKKKFSIIKKYPPKGFVYRKQLFIDQIANVINQIQTNPNDRRLIVSGWNVSDLDEMALPPCHYTFQFYVSNNRLSLMLNQRSCDFFLGVPFNIAQYSILLHVVAQITNLFPGEFIFNGGDCHIYKDHIQQVKEQLTRIPYQSPKLILNPEKRNINDFTFDDFTIAEYNSHPTIKAKVSV